MEAVRLTLEHDPFIQLRDAAADFQAGLAQEQTGFFDFTLLGNLFAEYRVQELTEGRKEAEREKRNTLSENIDRNREGANEAETLIARIQDVQDAPPGSESVDLLKEADLEIGTQVEIMGMSRLLLKLGGGSGDILRDLLLLDRSSEAEALISGTESRDQLRHISMSLQAPEACGRFEDAGGGPAQHHLAAPPALHVAG